MRKFNSVINTAFVSEAGRKLVNNDDFGFVEQDKFACYVVADGVEDTKEDKSAGRLAIYSVIRKFIAHPSMSKRTIKACLKEANRALLNEKSKTHIKASITIVVTDYVKMRYGQAGNTRLQFYRDGVLRQKSADQSLSQQLVRTGAIMPDKLAWHEERNNLTSYLGMGKGFDPIISKKIELKDGDLLVLYTRGIWENIDEGELLDVFSEAAKDVKEPIDTIEDMLLSKQPEQLENYTLAVIGFDKTFKDPNRKKRIKKAIIISLVILLIALLIWLITWLVLRDRAKKREEMQLCYSNAIEYIQDNNYIRAKDECSDALKLAAKLFDKEMRLELDGYMKLIEAVISSDDLYNDGKYADAQKAYMNAKERARYADNVGTGYIDSRLENTRDFLAVSDLIYLGDRQSQSADYKGAEEKYIEAKNLATKVYFDDGKKQAMNALDKLYSDQTKQNEANTEEAKTKAETEVTAADMIKQGDMAFLDGDYEGAKVFYNIAVEKYTDLADDGRVELIQEKLASIEIKKEEDAAKLMEAGGYEKAAQELYDTQAFLEAKKQYLFAKNIYAGLKKDDKVKEIEQKIQVIDLDAQAAEAEAAESSSSSKFNKK